MSPQADVRPASLDVLARTGSPVTISLTFPAAYLDTRTWTASFGGTSVTPSIDGDVMLLGLSGAQTTALGNGRHAILLTDTTGDDVVRIAGRLLLGATSTDQPDTTVTILTDTTVSVDVTVVSADITVIGGTGGGATNLAYTASPTDAVVTSDTGTDATLTAADGTNAGLFLPAEKTKLAGIEDGAQVNEVSAADLTTEATTRGDADAVLDSRVDSLETTAAALPGTYVPRDLSTLTASNAPDSDDLVYIWLDGAPRAVTVADLLALAAAGGTVDVVSNVATGRLLGRITAGSGDSEELTAAQVRTFLNVQDGATDDLTAAEILALLVTVDGSGSGLDADLLDGQHAAALLARANHTGTQTASTISDFDTQVRTSRLDQMAAPSADVSANGHKVTGLADGTASTDAVNKSQLDAAIVGIDWKPSARVATTGAGTLASSFENGATIDGVVLATGDRILIKDQATGSENGIYIVQASGAPVRATDADTSAEVTGGLAVWVNEGTTNGDSGWAISTNDVITLGTTALTFVQVTGLGQVTAGAALTKTGNTLDVAVDGTGIEVNADALRLKDDGVTNAKLANMAQALIKGRAAAAGTGDPTDLTAAQVKTILALVAADISDFDTQVAATAILKSLVDAKGDVLVGTADNTVARKAVGSNGQALIADSAQSDGLKWVDLTRTLRVVLDGGGSAITTGAKKVYVTVPFDCTITKARLLADQSGSIVVDVWKDTYTNFPPTVADTITASAKPTLSSAQKSEDSTLTGWTTSLSAGDIIEVNVDSASTVTKVMLDLFVRPR